MIEVLQHCCAAMDEYLDPENYDNGELLEYDPSIRSFHFILHRDGEKSGWRVPLLYCPWCGKKLPRELGDEWESILQNEYNILRPGLENESDLPQEFRTDEWWRKRGL